MKQPIKTTILSTLCLVIAGAATFTTVFADTPPKDICSSDASAEIKASAGCSGSTGTELPNVIVGILNAIIAVAGIVSVIYIIIGGINYMTSGGDTGKLKKAKDTILYALIGLIICALAFAIVNFAITNLLKQ